MRVLVASLMGAVLLGGLPAADGQGPARTLVTVWAHPDDELSVGPLLARYTREGVQVHIIIATDGSQGASNTSVPRGPEIAKLRAEEARCAAEALGIQPPILLGFPDGWLGNYREDSTLLPRLTQRIHEEVQRLRPDAVITWGPDGGSGHADHRLVSAIVTQLARAGAPGVPSRVFYSTIPPDVMRAMNPERGAPPFLAPRPAELTVRVPFTDADVEAARRSLACHKTQFTGEALVRLSRAMQDAWQGAVPLVPLAPGPASVSIFDERGSPR